MSPAIRAPLSSVTFGSASAAARSTLSNTGLLTQIETSSSSPGLGVAGNELVLPVLERPGRDDAVEDVGRLVDQGLAAEPEEVVRLAEMGDAFPLPPVEDHVRGAVVPCRRVALEQAHAAAAPREADRRGQPCQPAAENRDVGSDRPPGHPAMMRLRPRLV